MALGENGVGVWIGRSVNTRYSGFALGTEQQFETYLDMGSVNDRFFFPYSTKYIIVCTPNVGHRRSRTLWCCAWYSQWHWASCRNHILDHWTDGTLYKGSEMVRVTLGKNSCIDCVWEQRSWKMTKALARRRVGDDWPSSPHRKCIQNNHM